MASGVANLIFTYSFLKRLVTPFNETKAYELGIIDERGKKLKSPKSTEELNAYSTFERLVFNIKKIIERLPGGKSKLASYAAALFLIKEHDNTKEHYSEKELVEALEENMSYIKKNTKKTYGSLMSEKDWNDMMFKKETELRDVSEALKHTHMVLDTDGKVMSMHSNERSANDSAKGNNILKQKGRVVKLKKPMSTTRGDRLIGQLPAHNLGEDAPANATGTAVAGTGDDSSTVPVRPDARKKYMKKYLADYLKRRDKRNEAKKKQEMRKIMGLM
tara:strand:+ start:12871 stop:13695 length:825 start_codon:yes stop_codon:yes gene_type:complete